MAKTAGRHAGRSCKTKSPRCSPCPGTSLSTKRPDGRLHLMGVARGLLKGRSSPHHIGITTSLNRAPGRGYSSNECLPSGGAATSASTSAQRQQVGAPRPWPGTVTSVQGNLGSPGG
jgi:hypothetical protein